MYKMLEELGEDDAMMVELGIDDLTSELVQKIDKVFVDLRSDIVGVASVSATRFDRTLTKELLKRVETGLRDLRQNRKAVEEAGVCKECGEPVRIGLVNPTNPLCEECESKVVA